MIEIDFNHFTSFGEFKMDSAGSHRTVKGRLKGSEKIWYCKELKDPAIARIELLAQEFFRLFLPHQPETRIARNHVTGTYYILSEEVTGYRDLPYNEATNFENGTYKYLGLVLLIAMFVQEIYLKNRNVGLDTDNYVTKIDGDSCFAEKRWPNTYKITPKSIANLPYPNDFYTFNWLDLVDVGGKNPVSYIVSPTLPDSIQFRAEINEAIFKILLLPDSFIEQFVDAYIPAGGQYFIDLIKKKHQELLLSALENSSFVAYLEKPETKETVEDFLKQIKSFASGRRHNYLILLTSVKI